MPDLINEVTIKRKYFDSEHHLGILFLLKDGDLSLVRRLWNLDSHEIEDAIELSNLNIIYENYV